MTNPWIATSLVTFKNPDEAFTEAIKAGRLTADTKASNYAGRYLYMGTTHGRDLFKNIDTRKYDV